MGSVSACYGGETQMGLQQKGFGCRVDLCHSPERAPRTCSSAAAHRGSPKWGNQNLAWQQEITAGNKKEKNEAKWISGEQMAEGVKTKKQQEESRPPKKPKADSW